MNGSDFSNGVGDALGNIILGLAAAAAFVLGSIVTLGVGVLVYWLVW